MRRPLRVRAPGRARSSQLREAQASARYGGPRTSPLEAQPHERKVNFGDELVSPEEKTRRVGAVFSSVARRYDMMNDLMSGGMHRLWKDRFVNRVKPRSASTSSTWPAALATSPSAWHAGERTSPSPTSMPTCWRSARSVRGSATSRASTWKVENAEKLSFADATFDAYTIVFGIRNVTDIPAALREAHRVLKRGGRFFCMEFSSSDWPGFSDLYDAWASNVIPRIGKVVADDEDSYRYLVESIRRFPRPEASAGWSRMPASSAPPPNRCSADW